MTRNTEGNLLDIRNVELLTGRIIDDNPILVLSLHAQQVSFATAPDGSVIEGDKNKISHVQYILALSPARIQSFRVGFGGYFIQEREYL